MARATNPFQEETSGITRGRGGFLRGGVGESPYVTDPKGGIVKSGPRKGQPKRTPYGSPSGFGKLIENSKALEKWGERRVVLGIGVDLALIADCAKLTTLDVDSDEYKELADRIVVAAKDAAEANLAAERGTHGHAILEDDDEGRDWIERAQAGELLGIPRDAQLALVEGWRLMLERDGLEILASEASCVDDTWRLAGTLDNVARCTKSLRFRLCTGEIRTIGEGTVLIVDKKTGQRRTDPKGAPLYWHGYVLQVASYAQSVPYDTEAETRGVWPYTIDQEHALIAHIDVAAAIAGAAPADIVNLVYVDLVAGRELGGATVLKAKEWNARSDLLSVGMIEEPAYCRICDLGGHTCPGCGADTKHESPVCDECRQRVRDEPEPRLGRTASDGTCIIAEPSDSKTLCGAKVDQRSICAAKAVQGHIDGNDPAWCETCLTAWRSSTVTGGATTSDGADATCSVSTPPVTPIVAGDVQSGICPPATPIAAEGQPAPPPAPSAALIDTERPATVSTPLEPVRTPATAPEVAPSPTTLCELCCEDRTVAWRGPANEPYCEECASSLRQSSQAAGERIAQTSPLREAQLDRAAIDAEHVQALPGRPDEGDDLSADEYASMWDVMRTQFKALDRPALDWINSLIREAREAGVGFQAQAAHTARRSHIYRGVIALAGHEPSDEALLALCALALDSDAALFPTVMPGHALGSLDATTGARFAELVDAYITPDQETFRGSFTDDGRFVLTPLAASAA